MEKIVNDKLSTCKICGSDSCYSQVINEKITLSTCLGCGLISNTLYKEGHELFEKQKAILPDLYKDLIQKDENGQMYIPNMVNIAEKGMVFINGTDKEKWEWVGVLSVPVKEEEKTKFPIPKRPGEYYAYRMDMTTMKSFGKRGFIDALEYVDLLK